LAYDGRNDPGRSSHLLTADPNEALTAARYTFIISTVPIKEPTRRSKSASASSAISPSPLPVEMVDEACHG
jgi:hypothetical protein